MAEISWWMWLLLLLLFTTAYWYLSTPRNLPPGPLGIPLLGYLPFLQKEAHKSFVKLGKKFGNVFHLYFGSRLVVVLNDYDAIRDAYVKQGEIFSGRPADLNFREKEEDNLGIIATDGEHWKQHRRFILSNLRDYGVGKLALEPLLLNELQHCLAKIKENEGKSFAVKQLLNASLANNIHILVTGKRYDYDHPVMVELFDLFKRAAKEVPQIQIIMFFPWLAYFPGVDFLTKRIIMRFLTNEFSRVIGNIIKKVKGEYKEGLKENYVHAFMTERNSRLKVNNNEEIFTELGLLHNARDLLFAGTETSASTLHWAIIYMSLHPKVQKKVQEEIDQVIGREREPSYNDRGAMPYVEATIFELHRVISLSPMGVPHRTTRDTTVLGHFIPKDTMIFANLFNVHYDEKLWKDPHVFRPERFISKEGKFVKSEYVIPFSIGKRQCAGEPLARMELFLYFVSLLQHFDFVPPEGETMTLEVISGPARRPKCQNICAISRK